MKIRHRQNDADLLQNELCTVTGKFQLANGQPFAGNLVFTPEKAGRWQGVYYTAQPFSVKPDADGIINIDLPPSSAVGRYTVTSRPHGISFEFDIAEGEHVLDLENVPL